MYSLYIHIPFCKTKCYYCDFFSITNTDLVDVTINSIINEIKYVATELNHPEIITIYFGGGTPSCINTSYLEMIISECYKLFKINENVEITLELNPDDCTNKKIKELRKININRISVGIQSFEDKILKFLGRRHNANQAIQAIELLYNNEFKNISIDLIYGIPNLNITDWEKTLNKALEYPITHLSAYHLSIEKNTTLWKMLKKNMICQISEDESLLQYKVLCKILKGKNFIHYEISNFAKNNYYSIHNSNYWNGTFYIGIGPSAHSYIQKNIRRWNPPNLIYYINSWKNNTPAYKQEKLTKKQIFNEYLLTRLRTNNGIDLNYLNNNFNNLFKLWLENSFLPNKAFFKKKGNNYIIKEKYWFILDYVLIKLFL